MSIKFASVKQITFPPPQIGIFWKSRLIWEAAVRASKVLRFRNASHYGFLEKYHLHCFIAFVPPAAGYLRICVWNKVFKKIKHTYFYIYLSVGGGGGGGGDKTV